jgi:hypothetical protein
MATAIILLVSVICGVCGAGIAVAVAMIVWPESKDPNRGVIAKGPTRTSTMLRQLSADMKQA